MNKIFVALVLLLSSTYALTLQDIRIQLHASQPYGDTVEIKEQMIVTASTGTKQIVTLHIARKGSTKVYTDLQMGSIHQLSILSGASMQVTDMNSGTVKVLPAPTGANQSTLQATLPSPLDTGNWSDPVDLHNGTYLLSEGSMQVTYDSVSHHVTQIVDAMSNGNQYTTTIQYTAAGLPQSILTIARTAGKISNVQTEFLLYQSAKNFPDRFFMF